MDNKIYFPFQKNQQERGWTMHSSEMLKFFYEVITDPVILISIVIIAFFVIDNNMDEIRSFSKRFLSKKLGE